MKKKLDTYVLLNRFFLLSCLTNKLVSSNDVGTTQPQRQARPTEAPPLSSVLGLNEDDDVVEESGIAFETPDGAIVKRIDHRVKTYEVWDSSGVIEEPPVVTRGFGFRSLPLPCKMPDQNIGAKANRPVAASMFRTQPLEYFSRTKCQRAISNKLTNATAIDYTSTRFVSNRNASNFDMQNGHLDVMFLDLVEISITYNDSSYYKYYCMYDTDEQTVIKVWPGIYGAGRIPGGNRKIGPYSYNGTSAGRPLLPFVKNSGGLCQSRSADGMISVYHSKNQLLRMAPYNVFNFSCSTGPSDAVNGGFGPIADAFYNAQKTVEMLTHSDWGGLGRVNIAKEGALRFIVHYGAKDFENAFSDGSNSFYGDGGSSFYPLSSCIDVVAHEIGHSITTAKAKLIYTGESGCLSESFSDVIGVMVKSFISSGSGPANFLIGEGCTKRKAFIRNMSIPASYSDFFPHDPMKSECFEPEACPAPHECASITNYMFFKMASAPGWSIREAGRAWILANLLYWKPNTTIYQAGCDIAKVVEQFKIQQSDYDTVLEAWNAGGLDISSCVGIGACSQRNVANSMSSISRSRSSSTKLPTRRPTTSATLRSVISGFRLLENCQTQTNLSARAGQRLKFFVQAPPASNYANVQIHGDDGDADLYIKQGRPPTLLDYDEAPKWDGSEEWIMKPVAVPPEGARYFILIDSVAAFTNLELYACFL